GEGPGIYGRGGAGVGADVGPAGELGGSQNLNAFTGPSLEGSASLVGGISVSTNNSGNTGSLIWGAKGSPFAAHVANTTTKAFTLFDLFDAVGGFVDGMKQQAKQFIKEGEDAASHASGIQ
ncbi:MAG: hypothetical protein ABJA67_03505, partial [Chthonomonadales bacterium]